MATTAAYEATEALQAQPPSGTSTSGMQQAASCSVIGSDANVTSTLPGAKIGAANIPDALIKDVP